MARDVRWSTFQHEAVRICEHMGLKAEDVVGFDIRIRVGEPVRVKAYMVAGEITAKTIADALQTVSFEQKPEGDHDAPQ